MIQELAASALARTVIESPARIDQKPKCWRCRRLLAEFVARPWRFVCSRCKAENNSPKDSEEAA